MSEEVKKKDWIKEMIEREATPKTLREETIKDFAERHDIDSSLYHYHRIKKDNQEKILKLCLRIARERTPEVLDKLGEKAEAGNDRSVEMFLKFILELSEKSDLTSGGEPINIVQYGDLTRKLQTKKLPDTDKPSV